MITDFDIHGASQRLAVRHRLTDGSICGRVYDLASGHLVGEIGSQFLPQGLRFSPNGSQVSFFGDGSLYIYDIPQQAVVVAFHAPALHAGFCDWSPSGDALVFSAYPLDEKAHPPDIYVLDLPTQGVTQLTDTADVDRYPQWSPSGDYIAFQRQSVEDAGRRTRIHVVQIKTGRSTTCAAHPAASYTLGRGCWMSHAPQLLAIEHVDRETRLVVLDATNGQVIARREPADLIGVVRGSHGHAALGDSSTAVVAFSLPRLSPRGQVALPDGVRLLQRQLGPAVILQENDGVMYWVGSDHTLYQWVDGQGHRTLLRDPHPVPAFSHEEYAVRSADGRLIPTHRLIPPHPKQMAVVYVIGGPGASIDLEDPILLRLVAEGYEVICPAHRGQSGYGHEHQEANRGEYGLADVWDVVAAAQDWQQRTPCQRPVAVMGFSYGGYLTFLSLAATDVWACGISLWGVTRLEYLGMHRARAYPQDPSQQQEARVMRSPVMQASRIRAPLLMLHAGLDTTSTTADVQTIQARVEASGVPCQLVVYNVDTHGLQRHRPEMFAEILRFLDGHAMNDVR